MGEKIDGQGGGGWEGGESDGGKWGCRVTEVVAC